MTTQTVPRIAKWPFLLGDLILLAMAGWIAFKSPDPFDALPLGLMVGCVVVGAWISYQPFLREFQSAMKLVESQSLHTVADKLQQLDVLTRKVDGATSQWQNIQDQAIQTQTAVREITERMTAEATAFQEFMEKARDTEKNHLRMEVDKLRRVEGEWLQVLVIVMDQIYALYRGAVHSKQERVIQQITHFQRNCREIGRRIGLIPLECQAGDAFDPEHHQVAEGQPPPEGPAVVQETLATGYTFQGRPVRKILVQIEGTSGAASPPSAQAAAQADLDSGIPEVENASEMDPNSSPDAEEEETSIFRPTEPSDSSDASDASPVSGASAEEDELETELDEVTESKTDPDDLFSLSKAKEHGDVASSAPEPSGSPEKSKPA